jgi:hypothetical protein
MSKVKNKPAKDEKKADQAGNGEGTHEDVVEETAAVGEVKKKEVKEETVKKGKGRPKGKPRGGSESEGGSDTRPVLYPDYIAAFYAKGYQEPASIGAHEGEMTAARMRELLGWTEVESKSDDYDIKDAFGTKVKLRNNYGNRPFSTALARDWKLAVLKRHWRMNGETVVIGRHGMVESGQHRGVGLVLAAQEWSKPKGPDGRANYWHSVWGSPGKGGTEPIMPLTVVYGISEDDDTVNTHDTGRPRTSADAFYRSSLFQGYSHGERAAISRAMEFAVRTVWERTGQTEIGYTPRRQHADTFDFIDSHKWIKDAVEFIWRQNFGERSDSNQPLHLISSHVGCGVAAGLMYLMAASKSDFAKYHVKKKAGEASQRHLDMTMKDTAKAFWAAFAQATAQRRGYGPAVSPLCPLIDAVVANRIDGRAADLDVRLALIVHAWSSYVRHEGEVLPEDLKLKRTRHEGTGVEFFDDYPEIGGIDVPNDERRKSLLKKLDRQVGKPSGPEGDDIDGAEGFSPDPVEGMLFSNEREDADEDVE